MEKMTKTRITTTIIIGTFMIGAVTLGFSYFGSETESAIRSINAEEAMLETLQIENSNLWKEKEIEKQAIIKEQKVLSEANDGIDELLEALADEKRALGLN